MRERRISVGVIYLVLSLIQLECDAVVSRVLEPSPSFNASSECIFRYLQLQIGSAGSISLLLGEEGVNSVDERVIKHLIGSWPTQVEQVTQFRSNEARGRAQITDVVWLCSDFSNASTVQKMKDFCETEALRLSSLHIIGTKPMPLETIDAVFEILFEVVGSNVNMLVPKGDDFLRYSPIHDKEACSGSRRVDVWKSFLWNGNTCDIVDSQKANNASEQCKIRISGIHAPPYAYYDDRKGFFKGIEFFSIEAIAQKLDMSTEYTFLSNTSEFNPLIDVHGVFNQLAIG